MRILETGFGGGRELVAIEGQLETEDKRNSKKAVNFVDYDRKDQVGVCGIE